MSKGISSLKAAVTPGESGFLSALIWRTFRAGRVALLGVTIYGAGKAAGHVEVLDDPEGVRNQVINEVVMSNHHADDGKKGPGWHAMDSKVAKRVAKVGKRLLKAAREEIDESLAKLPPASEDEPSDVAELRGFLESAKKRICGTWNFVVTTSDVVNAFVTPMVPRVVFVNEGLLRKLKPTDDELAFLMGHELSHVIHGHGQQHIEEMATFATLQLVVLSLIDPTGFAALAITGVASMFFKGQERAHSREHEAQADETGLAICVRACSDPAAPGSLMTKLHHGQTKQHASWLDTHPAGAERVAALEAHLRDPKVQHHLNTECAAEPARKSLRKTLFGKGGENKT